MAVVFYSHLVKKHVQPDLDRFDEGTSKDIESSMKRVFSIVSIKDCNCIISLDDVCMLVWLIDELLSEFYRGNKTKRIVIYHDLLFCW